ncbi:MAG: adenylyltransferase/cytidyltransferase family protein, partial [Rhizobiaceae bacterium]
MTKRIAIYAGSFDPLTKGHLDVLKASLAVADTIYAGIGIQASKTPVFSLEERTRLIEAVSQTEFGEDAKRIKVMSF